MDTVFGKHEPQIPYRPIADLLAAYRQRSPDKLAIVDLDQESSITFGELDRAVIDAASALKKLGVRKGTRVLLLSDECLEKLLIWFATWRLGAVIAPLNIELNEKLIADLATAVNPVVTLVHKELDGNALLAGKPFIRFGAYSADPANADPEDDFFRTMARDVDPATLPERNDAADVACIFCTSGTTDRPKIVVYDHCAYWLNGLSTLECLGLTEDDRTLEYRSFGWNSAQVLSLMPFLEKGLTMHIAKRFSHSRFFEWIQKHGITFAAGVPTVLEHAAEQAARLHRQGCADAAVDDLQHRAADARAMGAVRGDVRRQAVADVWHVGSRLDVRQPPLQEQDGNGRAAGAASGTRDRRWRGQPLPARGRRRGDRGRAALRHRLSAG